MQALDLALKWGLQESKEDQERNYKRLKLSPSGSPKKKKIEVDYSVHSTPSSSVYLIYADFKCVINFEVHLVDHTEPYDNCKKYYVLADLEKEAVQPITKEQVDQHPILLGRKLISGSRSF